MNSRRHAIAFEQAGEKLQPQTKAQVGFVSTAKDWQLLVHLGRHLRFPDYITAVTLRADMVLMSVETKQLVYWS